MRSGCTVLLMHDHRSTRAVGRMRRRAALLTSTGDHLRHRLDPAARAGGCAADPARPRVPGAGVPGERRPHPDPGRDPRPEAARPVHPARPRTDDDPPHAVVDRGLVPRPRDRRRDDPLRVAPARGVPVDHRRTTTSSSGCRSHAASPTRCASCSAGHVAARTPPHCCRRWRRSRCSASGRCGQPAPRSTAIPTRCSTRAATRTRCGARASTRATSGTSTARLSPTGKPASPNPRPSSSAAALAKLGITMPDGTRTDDH